MPMSILLVGLNHLTAPVAIREKLALDSCGLEASYRDIKKPSLRESFLLSTCNRVEVLAVSDSPPQAIQDIEDFLASRHGLARRDFEDHLYVYEGADAVRHLFRVASSLDSMVMGEPQILGQLKEAFRQAVNQRATGAVLNKLLHKSFSVAKRVRTETGIASHAVSISYAAVELARKIFGRLDDKKVLLVGAGEMAELAAEHILSHGAAGIVVANRTLERAVKLAQRFQGRAAVLEELPALLIETDIVIASTGAPEVVVPAAMVKSVLRPRRHRPLFFVDIAVPRDVDPDVNRLENVYLYDIDDLKTVVEENREARQEEAFRAERIVAEETISFQAWLETLDTFPTIVALRNKAEELRRMELKRTLSRLGTMTPEQREALEVMTRALTQKLIHDPILFIKSAGRHGQKDFNLDLARRVLGLDRPTSRGQGPADEETNGPAGEDS
ncbi:MAG: glutamyl-tRNA reductase [Thermodesulfobacteriota bacterium]